MTITIAAIGCSGSVASVYIKGFLTQQDENVKIRLLTRTPKEFPNGVEIVLGSMMNPNDVAYAMKGVDAAFLLTPMAKKNQIQSEIDAAKAVLEGAKIAKCKHLIYTSVLGADIPQRGVGILDAKYEIEKLIRESNIKCSILRCGTYMQDVFDPRIELLNKGIFMFPISKESKICYTSQEDVSRFVIQELLKKNIFLKRPVNFTRAKPYKLRDVEELLSNASGRSISAVPKFPILYLLQLVLPIFNWLEHRLSSVIPLLTYFDQYGYTCEKNENNNDSSRSTAVMVETKFPTFQLTSLPEHLATLWPGTVSEEEEEKLLHYFP